MEKTLVIVESPAKAKTIGRYLGKMYRIAASVGHIRDLPSSVMGVDVKRNFTPQYIPMKGKNKVIRELQSLSEESESVLIATDPDREGEAIGWHLTTLLHIDPSSCCRIAFNEITEQAVITAVKKARPIDMNLVNAQQARRILDRLVGYELSPLLWKKIKKGLSAGRVQSVAVKMIIDRELEIEAFCPEEYWNLVAEFSKIETVDSFKAKYYGILKNNKPSKRTIHHEAEKNLVMEQVREKTPFVHSINKGNRKKHPYPPFTTSTLQQESSKLLGFSAKKTMSIAQQLYEGVDLGAMGQTALITYMRTDSVRSSADAIQEVRDVIKNNFSDSHLPKNPKLYKNKKNSQDGHEAIRPAHFNLSPESIHQYVSNDQFKLYRFIWNRFMASQMTDASVDTVAVDVLMGDHLFRTTGETIVFPGFLAVWGGGNTNKPKEKSEAEIHDESRSSDSLIENLIPDLKISDSLECKSISSEQKFTQPPPRYTEASLIKLLEEKGIGRPSTYAPTISTILDRKYIEKESKNLVPTQLGKVVNTLLEENFKNIVDPYFTAEMEKSLDLVEDGCLDWVELLRGFYPDFHEKVVHANQRVEKVQMEDKVLSDPCPECGGVLVEKDGRYGKFIACKNFPQCKYTKNIDEKINAKCPLCGSGIIAKRSRKHNGSKFYICDKQGSNPACEFISWNLPLENKYCKECGSYLVLKRFRDKAYPQCSNKDCTSKNHKQKKETQDQ
jgi:DNA topoisomerase I